MNFPMENPIFRFFYWLVDTVGIGSLAVGFMASLAIGAAGSALRWIVRGAQVNEPETYAYPTPTLHEHV